MSLGLLALIFSLLAVAVSTAAAAAETLIVPAGTRLHAVIDTPVNAVDSLSGDEITLRTIDGDITEDGKCVIPDGIVIKGTVWIPKTIEHMKFSKAVGLKFDTLIAANGERIPVILFLSAGAPLRLLRGPLNKEVLIKVYPPWRPAMLGTPISYQTPLRPNRWRPGQVKPAPVDFVVPPNTTLLFAKRSEKFDILPGDRFSVESAADAQVPVSK